MKLNMLFSFMCSLNVNNSTGFNIYGCCKARSNTHIMNYIFYYNDSDLTFIGSGPFLNTIRFRWSFKPYNLRG